VSLQIRREQQRTLEQHGREAFISEMKQHVRAFAPRLAEVIGVKGVESFVRRAVDNAEQQGFNLRGPTRLYLELMLTFGSAFATDPTLPWASEVLKDDKIAIKSVNFCKRQLG
jgi:hypothetical protein